jgi:hypothetical protein
MKYIITEGQYELVLGNIKNDERTILRLKALAEPFTKKRQFVNAEPEAYYAAKKLGVLDDLKDWEPTSVNKMNLPSVKRKLNVQEQVSRIQSMMGIISEKLEDIQGTPIYHKTSTLRGLDIINSDALRAGSLPSGDYLQYDKRLAKTKHQNAISFTRDKNWEPNHTIGIGLETPLEDSDMVFVVDKDKLKTKYQVEPFNYHGIEPDYKHQEKNDELEERVMTNEIYPLHKYIIDIIYTGDNPKVQEQINNYLSK